MSHYAPRTQPVSIYLPKETVQALKHIAHERKKPLSMTIRMILEDFVAQQTQATQQTEKTYHD